MMHFIQNLLSRHLDRDTNVKPRVRGMFEEEPDRMPDSQEDNRNRVATENEIQEFDKTASNQKHAQNFWVPVESRKGTLRKSQKQTDTPPAFALGAMSRPHEGYDARSVREEKAASAKPQSPQDVPVASKNNALKSDDSRGIGQIRYDPKVHLARTSNELDNVERGSKSKDSTYAIPESSRHLTANDGAAEHNEKPVLQTASPGNISPWQKGVMNTIGLPLIHAPSKPPAQHVVNISIGRVEIRASFPPAEVRIQAPEERTERITLDQYLNQQKSVNR